ncbi:protein RoBo-1-like [Acomys russatus]|uniref:protein RoBo-1-like n=1 Tax=Acomys russatus TaxID=60746 RepID=UPI0021E32468|nr:protein RoBo-1-like [Acomys russatus]
MAWSSILTVFVFAILAVSSVASVTDKILKPKGCIDTCSDLEFSATLGAQRTFRYVNRCCQTEQCNQDDIKETTPSLKANGLQCTACYNEKDKSCSATTTLMCTGEEKMCVEVTGTDKQTSTLVLYGKGCATENACKQDLTVNGNVQIKTTCSSPVATDGSPALKSITSLPIALLLLKVLL